MDLDVRSQQENTIAIKLSTSANIETENVTLRQPQI